MTHGRVVSILLLVVMACSSHDDVRTRYHLERMLWRAQFFQRRVNISFLTASKHDMHNAVNAYQAVVAADPLGNGVPAGWDPRVVADIRTLLLSARIALASLYFANERYSDARTLYAATLQLGSINFKDLLDVRMGAARASYMEGDESSVIRQCEDIFRDVQESPEFWSGNQEIDDAFLNIPVALVRMHLEAGDHAATDSAATAALAFYRRVSDTWSGNRLDWQARLAIAQVHMLGDDWKAAADDLQRILDDRQQQAGDAESIELVLGEIEAFRLSKPDAASARFQSLRERYPRTYTAHAAAYDLAALRLARGDANGAMNDFRDIERASGVPAAVASRAMLAHARILESRGSWDGAYALLRRLEQLYPFTLAAIEAPLVVTRHYVASGNQEMVRVATDHARDYYNSLLDRSSAFQGNRLMVQSALADNFVAAGKAREAAALLESGSQAWDDASTAAGMLKAADLYHNALHDDAGARETLQKIIDRYPDSRYARTARQRLHTLETPTPE